MIGMGCAPPHVALVSGLEGTGLGGEGVTEALRRVASAHGPASGRVLPKCKVMQNGCVLVGIDCPASLRIAQALSAALPGADTYYASQRPDQQLITLGRFAGTDAAGFAAWLSESLAGQRTLLPELRCVSVQLSEEAHPFPNPQIALTGMSGAGDGGGLGGGLGPGLGLNLGLGLGLGGGFGGFESVSSFSTGGGGFGSGAASSGTAAFGAAPASASVGAAAPAAPVAPPMPSTPPPQRAAMAPAAAAAPPSYASAIGAMKAHAAAAPAAVGPTVTPVAAVPPPTPPGGSFAQRAAAGVSSHPTPHGGGGVASMQVETPEQLLSVFQQLTSGAEGSGILCTSLTGGHAVRPQNAAAWSQRLAPLVNMMQSTLANVGSARFLSMLDRVANPYGTSLAAELGARLSKGARLEIVQDTHLLADIESTPVVVSNQGANVRLVCAPVNQAVVGAMGHSNTGSCVVVGSVRERGVDAASGLLRIAPLALHLDPIANVNAPSGTPYLTLTFAWLGLRVAGGAPAQENFPAATSSEVPAPQGARRPGDWTCARCNAHCFASRNSCFRCKRGKDEGPEGSFSPPGGTSKASSEAGGPGAGVFRAGDWICGSCSAHNFQSRDHCFKCSNAKTGNEAPPQSEGSRDGGPQTENFRSGDWICGSCSAHCFSSRQTCFRCSSARPAGA